MAAIEKLDLVVTVDISSALAKLEDLQEELQDLAESIETIDSRGTEGIDISTSLDNLDNEFAELSAEIEAFERAHSIDLNVTTDEVDLDGADDDREVLLNVRVRDTWDELADLRGDIERFEERNSIDLNVETDNVHVTGTHERHIPVRTEVESIEDELAELEMAIRGFEMAHDITIPVEFERSNLDRVTGTMRNLQNTSIQQTVNFTANTEAVDKAKATLEDVSADLGLSDLSDGELAVKNMKVAAADVTVIGDGDGAAEAMMDVLSGFDIDMGEDTDLDMDRDSAPDSGLDPTWLFGSRGGQRGSRDWFRDVFADPEDLQMGMSDIFGGPSPTQQSDVTTGRSNAEGLLNAIKESQDLGDAMENVRKTSMDLDAELEGFQKDLGDTRGQMMRMEASRAPNTAELFGMLERDSESVVGGVGGGDGGGRSGRFNFDFGDNDAFKRMKRSVSKLTSQADSASGSLSKFDLRMSDMHNLMATLIPLLFVFIGAMPAAITALVGLAAAAVAAGASLAAIAGFGAMGVALEGGQLNMQNLTEVWNEITDEFIEAFAPLAERLQPLFMDAVDGLELFFQAIADQGDALMELTDEARAFGSFLMDFVPGALQTLAATAEALSPILADIGAAINDGFRPAMRELVRLTKKAMPAVSDLVQTIVAALPTIVEVSIQFARVATAALDMIGFLWNIVTVFGLLEEKMALVVGIGLTLLTFLGLLLKILAPLFKLLKIVSLRAIGAFILALGKATYAVVAFAASLVTSAIGAIWSFAASIVSAIPVLASYTIAQYAATAALASFITLATIGAGVALVGLAASAASEFMSMADGIDSATNSLKEFDRVAGNTEGSFNPYDGNNPSASGARAAGGARNTNGGTTVINVESSGDGQEDRSNARYLSFRQGRTTGGSN